MKYEAARCIYRHFPCLVMGLEMQIRSNSYKKVSKFKKKLQIKIKPKPSHTNITNYTWIKLNVLVWINS